MYYIYFSHIGTYYISRHELDEDELHCEDCGDYDSLVCVVDDLDDLENELARINFVDYAYDLSNRDLACVLRSCRAYDEED